MPKKVCRAAANKMTNKSNASVIKKSENSKNGKDKPAENAEVKKVDIAKAKQLLSEQIAKYQQKAKLIENKELFEEKRDVMLKYLQEQGSDFDDSLDSRNLVLTLGDNSLYNSEGRISISNNMIIDQMLRVVIVTINNKITELEKEIVS